MIKTNIYELADLFLDAKICIVGGANTIDRSMLEGADVCTTSNNCIKHEIHPKIQFVNDDYFYKHSALYCVNHRYLDRFLEFAENKCVLFTVWSTDRHLAEHPLGIENHWANGFAYDLDTIPFSGICAVKFFETLPVSEIRITGFDFYEENGELPFAIPPHEIAPQLEWLAHKCRTDYRFKPDRRLSETLNKHSLPFKPKFKKLRMEGVKAFLRE